jgi:RNA polymerase sigma-70 factor, ECF subfamily
MHAYQDMVFSTTTRLIGDDALAADISQEVFLKAYESFAQLRASPTAGGWLKTVATRLALNHLSRYRRRWRLFSELRVDETEEEAAELEFPAPDTAAADIDADERRAIIDRAIQELPERQRVPLVLYHFEDMPYVEIATQLRISVPKVKTDIHRGRAALAKKLARCGVVPGALDS